MTQTMLSKLHAFSLSCIIAVLVSGCATQANKDPLEGINRGIYKFNDVAVATPRIGVTNVGLVSTTNLEPVPVWLAIDVAFPTEVIGPVKLAFVVTVSELPAKADFRFETCVVDVTANGAVPVASVLIN